jgi:hypothetical protein
LSDIVNFLKSLEFWGNIVYQMMHLKMNGFWAILYVWQEMVTSSQQPPESGCWAPFPCSWGTERSPTGPRPGAPYTLQQGQPPSSDTWGQSCSFPGALRAHTSNWSNVEKEKSNWRWKIADRCQLRCITATVRLLCDAYLLKGTPLTFRKF